MLWFFQNFLFCFFRALYHSFFGNLLFLMVEPGSDAARSTITSAILLKLGSVEFCCKLLYILGFQLLTLLDLIDIIAFFGLLLNELTLELATISSNLLLKVR